MEKELRKVFDNIINTCVGVVGDDCKDDLIMIGSKLGATEEELQQEFPNLYERGIDNIKDDDFSDQDGDDSLTTEEEIEKEETE